MIEGEKIIYIHKITGQIIEHEYIKQKINSSEDSLHNSNFIISITTGYRVRKIECKDDQSYGTHDYRYYIKDIPFSDDFDTVVVNNDIKWHDYERVIQDVKCFNRSTLDYYLLSRLKMKSNELKDIELKYGISF